MRLSIHSFYTVGKKRGWWRGIRNGDVLLFVASLALVNRIYESDPRAIQGSLARKLLSTARGEGWLDGANQTLVDGPGEMISKGTQQTGEENIVVEKETGQP